MGTEANHRGNATPSSGPLRFELELWVNVGGLNTEPLRIPLPIDTTSRSAQEMQHRLMKRLLQSFLQSTEATVMVLIKQKSYELHAMAKKCTYHIDHMSIGDPCRGI